MWRAQVVSNAKPPSKETVDRMAREQQVAADRIGEGEFRALATLICRQIAPQLVIEALFLFGSPSARPGRLSALSVSHSKSVLYGAFVWAHRALNSSKWWFPARAGWNSSLPHDTVNDTRLSTVNIAAMAGAWQGLGKHMSPRCCGC